MNRQKVGKMKLLAICCCVAFLSLFISCSAAATVNKGQTKNAKLAGYVQMMKVSSAQGDAITF